MRQKRDGDDQTADREAPAGRHANLRCERGDCHQQSFASLRQDPSSPATFPSTSRIVCVVASSFSSRATFA